MGNVFQHVKTISDKTAKLWKQKHSIFQIIYNLIHNGKRKTPMHVALPEAVHDTCQSKKLNGIMSHLGLCTSLEEVERTDTALV